MTIYKKILCYLFGHKYKMKRRITKSIAELQCIRCNKEFGINSTIKVVLELDKELKELHDLILKG